MSVCDVMRGREEGGRRKGEGGRGKEEREKEGDTWIHLHVLLK